MSNFFDTQFTRNINRYIQSQLPTRDKPIIATDVGLYGLGMDDVSYDALSQVRLHLDRLAAKKLLKKGIEPSVMAMDSKSQEYYIEDSYQMNHWKTLK